MLVGALIQSFPQARNVAAEVTFFHHRVRPYAPDQLVLGKDLAVAFEQCQQDIESLAGQGYRLAILQQKALLGIDAEGTKLVKQLSGGCFRIFPSFSDLLHGLAATNRRHWIG